MRITDLKASAPGRVPGSAMHAECEYADRGVGTQLVKVHQMNRVLDRLPPARHEGVQVRSPENVGVSGTDVQGKRKLPTGVGGAENMIEVPMGGDDALHGDIMHRGCGYDFLARTPGVNHQCIPTPPDEVTALVPRTRADHIDG